MSDPKLISILASVTIVIISFIQRRVVFSWSAIGAFWITHLCFVFVGLLAFPFLLPFMETSKWFIMFSNINFSLITSEDISWAILLTVGGGVLVLLFYNVSHAIFTNGKIILRAPNLLSTTWPLTLNFSCQRLLIFSSLSLLCIIAFVIFNLSIFIDGFREGFLGGSYSDILNARKNVTRNYFFVLVVYNVIPFFGVALWLLCNIRKSGLLRFYAILFNISVAILLFLMFQKRPLMIYLVALTISHLWLRLSKQTDKKLNSKVLIIFFGFLVVILMGLFYVQSIGQETENLPEMIGILSITTAIQIFGRTAIQPALFIHFYPSIEPHYGLTNIRLLSKIYDFELNRSTVKVFHYFRDTNKEGNATISALVDFYGAFGLIGWLLGAVLLGIMLNRIDAVLAQRKVDAGNILLKIFLFVFIYFLSQATFFQSVLGYGGIIFLLLWLALKLRIPKPIKNKIQIT